jgi:hypothetical protein
MVGRRFYGPAFRKQPKKAKSGDLRKAYQRQHANPMMGRIRLGTVYISGIPPHAVSSAAASIGGAALTHVERPFVGMTGQISLAP